MASKKTAVMELSPKNDAEIVNKRFLEANKMDEEIVETLVAPKGTTAVDHPDDNFSVSVGTDEEITVWWQGEGTVLSPEEVERFISKLAWSLEASALLSARVPF